MGVIRFIARVLGWVVTIVLQIAGSFINIFVFSVIFAGVDTVSRAGWLALIFMIWLGYVLGINLVGMAALHWVWKNMHQLNRQRLVGTAIGAAIPLLILLPIGFSVPVGDEGTRFYDLVTNYWQPVLAQASILTGIVGYYVPGLVKSKPQPSKSE